MTPADSSRASLPDAVGKRESWRAHGECLRAPGGVKPAVWKVADGSAAFVVKDIGDLSWFGRLIGRWLLYREARVLGKLRGIEGVPQLVGRPDHGSLVMTWLAGRPLDRLAFQGHARDFADQLARLLGQLHERGVFHLDVRQRRNVLLTNDSQVRLVDFGAALAPWAWAVWLVRPVLAWVDQRSVLKYLARYAPDELTQEEARATLRAQRLRRLWVVSPHRPKGEAESARDRSRDEGGAPPTGAGDSVGGGSDESVDSSS